MKTYPGSTGKAKGENDLIYTLAIDRMPTCPTNTPPLKHTPALLQPTPIPRQPHLTARLLSGLMFVAGSVLLAGTAWVRDDTALLMASTLFGCGSWINFVGTLQEGD